MRSPSSAVSSPPCGTTTERSAGLICNLLPAFATCFLGSLTSRFQHNCIIYIETPRPFRPRGFGFLSANGKSQQMAHSKSRKTFSPLVSNATCESPPLRTADLTKRVQYPLAKTLLFYRQNTHVCIILSAILICATMLCEKTFLPFRLLSEDAHRLSWLMSQKTPSACHLFSFSWSFLHLKISFLPTDGVSCPFPLKTPSASQLFRFSWSFLHLYLSSSLPSGHS